MGEEYPDTETPDIGDSNSLSNSLEEIRRRYDDEEDRRSAIDAKISGLLALNALLLTLVTTLPDVVGGQWRLLTQIILLLSAVLSFIGLVFGHWLWGEYSRPLQHPGQIYSKVQKSESDFNENFLDLYTRASKKNERINDCKWQFLVTNFVVTSLAICVILVGVYCSPLV